MVPGPEDQVLQQEYGRDALGVARYAAARVKAGAGEEVRVWDTASGRSCIPGDPGRWRQFAFAPDATRLLLVGPKGAQLWDLHRRQPVGALRCDVWAFSPDGERMLVRLEDQSVWIYQVLSPPGTVPDRIRLPLDGEPQPTYFSPKSALLITTTTRPCVRVWDWNGKPRSPEVHPSSISYLPGEPVLSLSPDGRRALLMDLHSAGGRTWSTATLLNLTGRTPPRQLGGGTLPGFTTSVFSPDGTRVVLLALNGQAQVWDAVAARPISPLLLHGKGLDSAAFSSDGRLVAIGTYEGTVSVWDIRSGKLVTPILSHPGTVDRLEFSADRRLLLSHSTEGTARVWDGHTVKRSRFRWT